MVTCTLFVLPATTLLLLEAVFCESVGLTATVGGTVWGQRRMGGEMLLN